VGIAGASLELPVPFGRPASGPGQIGAAPRAIWNSRSILKDSFPRSV
jgi:hypothetical protein